MNTATKPERLDIHKDWLAAQKIPVVGGFFIDDIDKIELAPWDLMGVPAAFAILEGTGGTNDAQIVEIPPAGKTKPIKHMYESMVYITKGHGNTTVWQKNGRKHSFEWGPGSLFAIPINAHYQHFNSSGSEPARYFAVTNCCFMMKLLHSVDFIFDCDFVFDDRFDPNSPDYFGAEGDRYGRFLSTNFIPDTRGIQLSDYSERGKDSTTVMLDLAGNSMGAHISEFGVGTYKKAHKHGPGAHVIILTGKGYSMMWPQGSEPKRFDWGPGSVVVPPDQWFHQHFNAGAEPARYLALRWHNWRFKSAIANAETDQSAQTSVKLGGGQIEFEDEDPAIHRDFHEAMRKAGAHCVMDYHPECPANTSDSRTRKGAELPAE